VGFAPLSDIERPPGLSTVTRKVHPPPFEPNVATVVVPTGKNEPDAGEELIGGTGFPFSSTEAWPQSPVVVGAAKVTIAPLWPGSALTVIFCGQVITHGVVVTVVVELARSFPGF
jgi:hypothetical protein